MSMKNVDVKDMANKVEQAYKRISPHIHKTPLLHSLALSKQTGAHVYLKLENEQKAGSFKVRGAFNKLMTCIESDDGTTKGYVTASTGNHGMASALAFSTLKQQGMVFVPETVADTKERTLRLYDVKLEKYGTDCVETEKRARSHAEANGLVFISPYADMDVIFGQGTIGKEVIAELPNLDAMFITVGGGGLIAGVAGFLKAYNTAIEVVGCLPKNSPVMHESVKAGCIVDFESLETLSDASAGGIEDGSPTVGLCSALVDTWVTVSEEEISTGMNEMLETHHKVVEGSAGVALAAFRKTAERYRGKRVAVLICGANVSMSNLNLVLQQNK